MLKYDFSLQCTGGSVAQVSGRGPRARFRAVPGIRVRPPGSIWSLVSERYQENSRRSGTVRLRRR